MLAVGRTVRAGRTVSAGRADAGARRARWPTSDRGHGAIVRLAQASGHRGEHLAGQRWNGVEHAVELTLAEHQERHVSLRDHRRRAWAAVEQCHLAEVLARAERRHLAVVAPHRGLTRDDEEELPADGPLLTEHP